MRGRRKPAVAQEDAEEAQNSIDVEVRQAVVKESSKASGGDANHPPDPAPTHLSAKVGQRRATGVICITPPVNNFSAIRVVMKAINIAEAFLESAGGLGWPSEAVRRLDEALNYLLNGVTMIRVEAEEAANSPDCEVTVNPYDVWNVRDNNPHRLGVHSR